MPDVVVVGAGIGGMAVAARLAKLGHRVTVVERSTKAGGRLHALERLGFRWEAGPASVGLPAVLRDLFRKSGRPIERYLPLGLRVPARRHLFEGGAVVDLPTGSRAAQIHALDEGLGAGAGLQWSRFVDNQAAAWNQLRLSEDGPDGGSGRFGDGSGRVDGNASPAERSRPVRGSLDTLLQRALPDERLRRMVDFPYELAGTKRRSVPASRAVGSYVERSFGVWTLPAGLSALSEVLVTRLAERGVELRCGSAVTRIVAGPGGVSGVDLADGSFVAADLVVATNDPLSVFSTLLGREGARPAKVFASSARPEPPGVAHLGLRGENPAGLPGEIVLHGDPVAIVETAGSAPQGHRAWTIRWAGGRGVGPADVLAVLASRGLDVRDAVVTRVDRSPEQRRSETGEAADPIGWDSERAQRRRSACATPLRGLSVLGAPLLPGAAIPEVAWTAAHIAGSIGKA